jgi:4a-hydroxytetrahydrobiopterin dehydratase
MSDLSKQQCEACSPDAPTATEEEKQSLGANVPDWSIVEVDGEEQLKRTFKFKNFAQAQAFTNKVGDLAEEVDHHPVIILEYGKVTVHWWSHEIHGLHKNDFIMAARTDQAYSSFS